MVELPQTCKGTREILVYPANWKEIAWLPYLSLPTKTCPGCWYCTPTEEETE